MDEVEVEIHKVQKPASLMTIETLGGVEEGEVFVVGEDLDWEGGAMKVMAPSLEGTDDGKKFPIIYVIIMFRQ